MTGIGGDPWEAMGSDRQGRSLFLLAYLSKNNVCVLRFFLSREASLFDNSTGLVAASQIECVGVLSPFFPRVPFFKKEASVAGVKHAQRVCEMAKMVQA